MDSARVDVGNTDRPREIVRERAGQDVRDRRRGRARAWLLAQHAGRQVDFRREVLPLLDRAPAAGEAEHAQVAYLTDGSA